MSTESIYLPISHFLVTDGGIVSVTKLVLNIAVELQKRVLARKTETECKCPENKFGCFPTFRVELQSEGSEAWKC